MLAQNFMTAADLDIPERARAALITVLGMLERGEIQEHEFNMAETCGTACCIYGWMRHVDREARPYELKDPHDPRFAALNDLFMFNVQKWIIDMAHFKPDDGARALRNYLTTGAADWNKHPR